MLNVLYVYLDCVCTEQVAVLKGHTGLVKGVCWDPVGKYLASQSDDRSMIVWRTRDWQQDTVVTDPFKEVCQAILLNIDHWELNTCLLSIKGFTAE